MKEDCDGLNCDLQVGVCVLFSTTPVAKPKPVCACDI